MRNYPQTVYTFITSNCSPHTVFCKQANTSSKHNHQLVPQSKPQKIQNMCGLNSSLIHFSCNLFQTIVYLFIQTVAFVSVHPLNIHSTECWTWIIMNEWTYVYLNEYRNLTNVFHSDFQKKFFCFRNSNLNVKWCLENAQNWQPHSNWSDSGHRKVASIWSSIIAPDLIWNNLHNVFNCTQKKM